jgi:hypothetical protein
MSTKPSNTVAAAPAACATVINYSDAKVAWAWRRIERLCQQYVDGDPEISRLSTEPNPQPLGETVSLASAMQAGIPLEPVRELWAQAKAHMVALEAWKAENASDAEGGPAA